MDPSDGPTHILYVGSIVHVVNMEQGESWSVTGYHFPALPSEVVIEGMKSRIFSTLDA